MLIGGVIGGVVFFLLGYLIYGLLMSDMMASCMTCQRLMEDLDLPFLIVGNLFAGWFIAFAFSKMSGVTTFAAGVTTGAILGLLMSVAMNCIMYATSTIYSGITCIVYDVIISIIIWGLTGGVIAWWLGRK